MRDILNCPNCGAPIQDDICPYCGSVFLDWATFDVKRPTFVKVKDWRGHVHLIKLGMASVSLQQTCETCMTSISMPDITIEAEFNALPFRHPISKELVLMIDINPEKMDKDKKRSVLNGIKEE